MAFVDGTHDLPDAMAANTASRAVAEPQAVNHPVVQVIPATPATPAIPAIPATEAALVPPAVALSAAPTGGGEDRRYDYDGKPYTLPEFIGCYGGTVEKPPAAWRNASMTPWPWATQQQPRPQPQPQQPFQSYQQPPAGAGGAQGFMGGMMEMQQMQQMQHIQQIQMAWRAQQQQVRWCWGRGADDCY